LLGAVALGSTALAYWALQQLAEPPQEPQAKVVWPPPKAPPPEDRRVLRPVPFAALAGWAEDDLAAALPAFRASCARFEAQSPDTPVGPDGVAGTVGDWQPVCRRARALSRPDAASARAFFEELFQPYQVLNGAAEEGLFTGYYEPTLQGRRRRSARYATPLYRRPGDIVTVDLGKFRPELEGQRLAGRLRGKELEPYPDRLAIDQGALAKRGLELLWVEDPIDAFFLHIQGSGRVELEGGDTLRVGYAGQNGRPYVAIGRELVTRGALPLEEVSMQSIRRWLEENPDQRDEVLAANPSYVFFRLLKESGPVGSQGVVLTPGRSLAVDRRFLPLGAPFWLDATMPALTPEAGDEPLRRLVVAQDTGGAIRGPVRGDVFWGPGPEAAERAGRMKHPGRLWLLLPRTVPPPAL
jgi:membrane-bound lytic murein transglycosylase A